VALVAAHSRAMRRGWRRPALLAAASSGLSCRAVVQWKVSHLVRDNPQVLYRVETRAKAIALTIDDGPDAATTPEILSVLERNGAHATFFIITSRVPGNEELLRRIVAEGHELGNHLLQDEGRRTVKTLSNVLPALAKRGFRIVTLTELEGLRNSS